MGDAIAFNLEHERHLARLRYAARMRLEEGADGVAVAAQMVSRGYDIGAAGSFVIRWRAGRELLQSGKV